MISNDQRTAIQECIDLLKEPSDQLEATHKLIGICMEVRTERQPAEHTVVLSLLREELESPLIEYLRQVTPLVRRKLVFVLGKLGGRWEDEPAPEAVRALARIVWEDSNADVRAAAVDALGELGGPDAMTTLKDVAKEDPVSTVRVRALFALDRLAPKPRQPTFGPILVDQFLAEMAQADDRDTNTVARELQLRRGLGL
jgi:HEAT repeat protein